MSLSASEEPLVLVSKQQQQQQQQQQQKGWFHMDDISLGVLL